MTQVRLAQPHPIESLLTKIALKVTAQTKLQLEIIFASLSNPKFLMPKSTYVLNQIGHLADPELKGNLRLLKLSLDLEFGRALQNYQAGNPSFDLVSQFWPRINDYKMASLRTFLDWLSEVMPPPCSINTHLNLTYEDARAAYLAFNDLDANFGFVVGNIYSNLTGVVKDLALGHSTQAHTPLLQAKFQALQLMIFKLNSPAELRFAMTQVYFAQDQLVYFENDPAIAKHLPMQKLSNVLESCERYLKHRWNLRIRQRPSTQSPSLSEPVPAPSPVVPTNSTRREMIKTKKTILKKLKFQNLKSSLKTIPEFDKDPEIDVFSEKGRAFNEIGRLFDWGPNTLEQKIQGYEKLIAEPVDRSKASDYFFHAAALTELVRCHAEVAIKKFPEALSDLDGYLPVEAIARLLKVVKPAEAALRCLQDYTQYLAYQNPSKLNEYQALIGQMDLSLGYLKQLLNQFSPTKGDHSADPFSLFRERMQTITDQLAFLCGKKPSPLEKSVPAKVSPEDFLAQGKFSERVLLWSKADRMQAKFTPVQTLEMRPQSFVHR